jgi:serine/threonine protein kinase
MVALNIDFADYFTLETMPPSDGAAVLIAFAFGAIACAFVIGAIKGGRERREILRRLEVRLVATKAAPATVLGHKTFMMLKELGKDVSLEESSTGEQVAIKRLFILYLDELEALHGLLMHVTGFSLHRNVLRYIDVYRESTMHLTLVMEYADGGSMTDFISKHTLHEGQKAQCMLDIARGVEHLHKNGHVHGSISANHILLAFEPLHKNHRKNDIDKSLFRCLISGMCLEATVGSTRSDELSERPSTMMYCAPEARKIKPKRSDRMDIWSCGVLCYWLLVGTIPSVCDKPHVFTPMDWSACPIAYRKLVRDMLDEEPLNRPSAQDVVEQLNAINSAT